MSPHSVLSVSFRFCQGKSCLETPGQRGPSITRDEVIDNRHSSNENSYSSLGVQLHQLKRDSISDADNADDGSVGVGGVLELQELLKRVHRT